MVWGGVGEQIQIKGGQKESSQKQEREQSKGKVWEALRIAHTQAKAGMFTHQWGIGKSAGRVVGGGSRGNWEPRRTNPWW